MEASGSAWILNETFFGAARVSQQWLKLKSGSQIELWPEVGDGVTG